MKLSSIFLIIGFLTVYFCLFITQILPLLLNMENKYNQRRIFKKMGNQLLSINNQTTKANTGISLKILSFLLLFTSLIMISINFQIALTALTFSITTLVIIKYQYIKINGVYENGIIYGDIVKWDKIHSWKIDNNTNISILKKNGFSFNISELGYVDEISKILREKKIVEEI